MHCPQPLRASLFAADCLLPLVLTMPESEDDAFKLLLTWITEHRRWIEETLLKHGGILLRGCGVQTAEMFEQVVIALQIKCVPYTQGSSPRSRVHNLIYTSTNYVASKPIPLHTELSYTCWAPHKIVFFCETPPATEGQTPIASTAAIYQKIPADLRQRFLDRKIRYTKNMVDGEQKPFELLGKPWQQQFETSDRTEVEAFLNQSDIQYVWKENGTLVTHQVLPAITQHPITGETVWFCQPQIFHYGAYGKAGQLLCNMIGEENMPMNATYGDGSPISPEEIQTLCDCADSEATVFSWQKGDVLVLDNFLVAHGRRSYSGDRKILAALGNSPAPIN